MKKILNLLLILGAAAMLGACSKVPAGNVGIKVYLLGKDKGVDTEELSVGRYFIGINEELYLFPTFKQNYSWTADTREGSEQDESFTFQTKEGMEVGADIGITYHLDATKINGIFQKYRRGIDEITDSFLRNHVRDAFNSIASDMSVESVYGSGKADLIEKVQQAVSAEVGPEGIVVEKIYLIGTFRLPESVVRALNSKIEATQRAQQRENELREAEAEAKKKVAEAEGQAASALAVAKADAEARLIKAKAEAQANKIVSQSLTTTLIQYEKIKSWDGKLPQFQGAGTPLINIDSK